jgi:anti-sigma factor RsiW
LKGGKKMSNCSKISELLSAYLDGEISAKDKEIVETHLTECASCKQKLEIMQKTQNILKNTPPMPVPETLLKDFEEYRKKSEQTEKIRNRKNSESLKAH